MDQRKILSDIRHHLNLTQVEMSKRLQLAYSSYQQLEYAIRKLQVYQLEILANLVPEMDLDSLIRKSELQLKKGGEVWTKLKK